jgi:hypothetical protein
MDLEQIALVLWVDSRHLIDLMLVDRNLILDLIALDSKRENGYRHPHYIIVTLTRAREEDHTENCMKNTHVQAFELIEERFDSNSWFVLFLCTLMLCS